MVSPCCVCQHGRFKEVDTAIRHARVACKLNLSILYAFVHSLKPAFVHQLRELLCSRLIHKHKSLTVIMAEMMLNGESLLCMPTWEFAFHLCDGFGHVFGATPLRIMLVELMPGSASLTAMIGKHSCGKLFFLVTLLIVNSLYFLCLCIGSPFVAVFISAIQGSALGFRFVYCLAIRPTMALPAQNPSGSTGGNLKAKCTWLHAEEAIMYYCFINKEICFVNKESMSKNAASILLESRSTGRPFAISFSS